MPIYEEFEHNWFRRIDDYGAEAKARAKHGYGFFRLVETSNDAGKVAHRNDLEILEE